MKIGASVRNGARRSEQDEASDVGRVRVWEEVRSSDEAAQRRSGASNGLIPCGSGGYLARVHEISDEIRIRRGRPGHGPEGIVE